MNFDHSKFRQMYANLHPSRTIKFPRDHSVNQYGLILITNKQNVKKERKQKNNALFKLKNKDICDTSST